MTVQAFERVAAEKRASFGIDAPGVVWGFFGATLVLGGGGMALARWLGLPWSIFGWMLEGLAIVPLCLGISMLVYSFIGKQRLRDHLLRQRLWRGDEVVLDIGAGQGLMAIGAAHRVPRGKVFALDIWSAKDLTGNSPDALLGNAAVEQVTGRIDVVTGDARQLTWPDGFFDVVVSVFCIHNIEDDRERQAACREIARVLKPGGMAMIADFPGVGGYVDVFREAGLRVAGPFRAERIALTIAGYLVAAKD